eukprot:6079847-Amphidinium_carterae.1
MQGFEQPVRASRITKTSKKKSAAVCASVHRVSLRRVTCRQLWLQQTSPVLRTLGSAWLNSLTPMREYQMIHEIHL